MPWYVYILKRLKDGRYYIGSSAAIMARLRYHNSGLQRSTQHRILFENVIFEIYSSKEEALKREKQIKA
jgi:putative endonuclease